MKTKIIATLAALGALSVVQPYRVFLVSGTSMTPTYENRQLLVGMIRPSKIERGDVIVFRHNDETMIKRVAFIPGDRLERFKFCGSWYLPGTQKGLRYFQSHHLEKQIVTVRPNSLYVLADNPWGTLDSRTFGSIASEDVIAVISHSDEQPIDRPLGTRLGGALFAQL